MQGRGGFPAQRVLRLRHRLHLLGSAFPFAKWRRWIYATIDRLADNSLLLRGILSNVNLESRLSKKRNLVGKTVLIWSSLLSYLGPTDTVTQTPHDVSQHRFSFFKSSRFLLRHVDLTKNLYIDEWYWCCPPTYMAIQLDLPSQTHVTFAADPDRSSKCRSYQIRALYVLAYQ